MAMADKQATRDEGGSLEAENRIDDAFVEIANALPVRDRDTFSERELKVLELYDKLEDLRLGKALTEAQIELTREPAARVSEQDIQLQLQEAERKLLDARALYLLRNSIADNVVQADPLLKAIHSGQRAGPVERTLHPIIDHRDVLSLVQTNLAASLQTTLNTLTTTRTENLKAIQKNQELTATLLDLADQTKAEDIDSIEDPRIREELQALQRETKDSKRRYRIVKSLVGAVVAGSGVDWSRDEQLRQLMLDDEEEFYG